MAKAAKKRIEPLQTLSQAMCQVAPMPEAEEDVSTTRKMDGRVAAMLKLDPAAIVRGLDPATIRQRIDALNNERAALLVLLRAAMLLKPD